MCTKRRRSSLRLLVEGACCSLMRWASASRCRSYACACTHIMHTSCTSHALDEMQMAAGHTHVHAHIMHTPCTHHAHIMHTSCTYHAHIMHISCTYHALDEMGLGKWLQAICTCMHTSCTQHALDEMGLCKWLQALAIASAYAKASAKGEYFWPLLIVCPLSMRDVW